MAFAIRVWLTLCCFRPASYPGYMDANISSEPLRSYYGKSLDLLKLIKLKHDPKDFFDNPLGVPPASFGFPF